MKGFNLQSTGTPHVWWQVFLNVVFSLTGAYGLSLTLFHTLRLLTGETFNTVALFNNIIHVMLLPVLVLLPLALAFRRWYVSVMLVVPFGVALATNVPLFVGAAPPAPANVTEITVMTYNLLARGGNFDESNAIIRASGADVVALQEVWFPAEASIQTALSDAYPYMALHITDVPVQGQGILSRYPILEDEFIASNLTWGLGHQRTVIDVNGTAVVVYNTHPVHPGIVGGDVSQRGVDIDTILPRAAADAASYPVLLLGDFNLTPSTADHARITQTFTDSHQQVGVGLGYTFPADHYGRVSDWLPPLARIDYVFHDGDWLALQTGVWPTAGGSDHYPMWARLALLPRCHSHFCPLPVE